MEQFEQTLQHDLHRYLLAMNAVDERLPECPDVEGKWPDIANAYLPDGIREFNDFPTASLGWMMYIGMAVARYWDMEWEIYSHLEDLYAYIRDKRGYDNLDDYVASEVLLLPENEREALSTLVAECAGRVHHALMHQNIEPGTREALMAYVACLHQLYLMGAATELHRLGYHMVKLQ